MNLAAAADKRDKSVGAKGDAAKFIQKKEAPKPPSLPGSAGNTNRETSAPKSDAANPPLTGLSGRNLYFQQLRNEITMSESNKYKGLPDYQNAKYSNKRNGLVSGYGANTN
jgi:hypothetical protein